LGRGKRRGGGSKIGDGEEMGLRVRPLKGLTVETGGGEEHWFEAVGEDA